MTNLPSVGGENVVKALTKAGYFEHHKKGSHVIMKHPEDPTRRVVVPVHKGKDLGKGLLLAIIKDSGMTIDEFLKFL